MPVSKLIALDEEATGPRSAAEYAAFRAAHAALPHAELRRIADHRRAALILAHHHAADRRKKAEADAADAKKLSGQKKPSDQAKAAAKAASEAAARTLAELDAMPAVPDLAPCTVDRCPGHATLSIGDLKRAARTIRPLTHSHKEAAAKKRAAA